MVEARYYEKLENKKVRCKLCPHGCVILPGNTGFCRARKNIDGKLYSLNYGYISSIAFDPIEKKPLYHFYPGSSILSIGTFGCSFRCQHCQNFEISQLIPNVFEVDTERLIELAKKDKDCIGIAFTYNEPTIWFEYVLDVAKKFKEEGFKTVLVTNGYLNEEPLLELLEVIDAANIDLKAFNDEFYKKVCSGDLESVKRFIEICNKKIHIEITTLIIPTLNDSEEEVENLAKWLSSIDDRIPLHLTRYFPRYKMTLPPTPKETLFKLREIAKKYLMYVYLGNI
ncbi:Radical SAM domain protein [Caldicellulosiruptor saccharolyticus DSM 8903]|uniref:Radical SAM domain protein n=1 Tax=Caldicellulosiruptor saccharolyticus (strain ATCC 43494 / DSM 8903 / Tp8T 6331) TaxID=351627 RepID=A4XIQ0_CALS8|nr:AmmeMemoRadiSam system radical SAM enzyme [Caldicellulosiruptor saccharolyticus]ABP66785.1 Radical SAM domain protein [Caldicellulosiruptor saccharolyticus DSM 8903]